MLSSELTDRPLTWNELPFKTDLVVWIPLSNIQKRIYEIIVTSHKTQKSLTDLDKKHIFVTILALKQLCVHPMILLNKVYKDQLEEKKVEESSDSAEQLQP